MRTNDLFSQVMKTLDQDNRFILCTIYFKVVEQIHKMGVEKTNYIAVSRRIAAELFTTHPHIDTPSIREAITNNYN